MVLGIVKLDALMETEHLLMQIIGEHQRQHQHRRDRQIVHPLGMGIIHRLIDVLHHEETDQGDQHHRNIIGIPNVASNGVGTVCDQFIFYSTHRQPEGHQNAHCYQKISHLPVGKAALDGNAPGDEQTHMDRIACHHSGRDQQRLVGIIGNNPSDGVCNQKGHRRPNRRIYGRFVLDHRLHLPDQIIALLWYIVQLYYL